MTISDSSDDRPTRSWFERLVRTIVRALGWVFGRIWDAIRFVGRTIKRMFGWTKFVGRIFTKPITMWHKPKPNSDKEAELRRMVEKEEMVGTYFSAFETNFIFRPLLSTVAAFMVVAILFVTDTILGSNMLPWWAALILLTLLATLFALNDDKIVIEGNKKLPLSIPENHVGILTFFGTRLNAYLEEGDHYWYGGKLGFGVSTAPLTNRKDYKVESEKGFVFIGDRAISIWPNLGESGQVRLKTVSGSGSTNTSTLTITFKVYWPLAWANSDDPILDIAERSRSGLRSISSFLPGFDNVKMQSIFSGLMGGGTLVTALTKKSIDIFPRGSVIQDASGRHIFEIVKYNPDRSEADHTRLVDNAKARVSAKIIADGDEEMKTMVVDPEDNPRTQVFSLNKVDDIHEVVEEEGTDKHLVPVMTDCGCHLERATIAEILTSEQEQEQANIAASESFQRRAQRMNAEAMHENTETMRKNLKEEGGEAALAAALAADGKASFVHVSGGDRLSRATVAAAKTLGDKK